MLVQAGRRLGRRIETDVRWLLPEDRALLGHLAIENLALLLKQFSDGDCSIFQRYSSVALGGLNPALATFPDESALAATLPLEPLAATTPGLRAAPVDLEDLRRQLSAAALVESRDWADSGELAPRPASWTSYSADLFRVECRSLK
jgi:hypothetical protein